MRAARTPATATAGASWYCAWAVLALRSAATTSVWLEALIGELRAGEGQDNRGDQGQADAPARPGVGAAGRPSASAATRRRAGDRDEQGQQPQRVGELNGHGGRPATPGPRRRGPLRPGPSTGPGTREALAEASPLPPVTSSCCWGAIGTARRVDRDVAGLPATAGPTTPSPCKGPLRRCR